MKNEMYAVRDAVSGIYNSPYHQINKKVAIRTFREACNNVPEIKDHAEDMELWYLGSYDNETGYFCSEPELIEKGVKNNV